MISDICSDLLVSLCSTFDARDKESGFTEKALKIFVEKLGRNTGFLFTSKDNQIQPVVAWPESAGHYSKIAVLTSVLRSTLSKQQAEPTVLAIGHDTYDVIEVRNFGYMLLGRDSGYDKNILTTIGSATDHLGSLLRVLSDSTEQKLKGLFYRNLAFVASKTTDMISITDSEGYITYVNDAYSAVTGYPFNETLGKRPSELMHGPETSEEVKNQMLSAIVERRNVKVEILNYTKQKKKFWLQITIDPVFDEQGKCIAFVSVGRDISDRKTLDKELVHKEDMLRSIVACSNEFLVNPDLNDAVARSLPVLGKAVDVDRVYFFRNSLNEEGKLLTSMVTEWNSGAFESQMDNQEMQNLPIDVIDIFLPELYQRRHVAVVVSELDPELPYRKMLESQDVKSMLIFPIFIGDFFWGIVGFDECKHERIWFDDEISILQNFCISITNAEERAKVTDELVNLYLLPKESPTPLVRTDLRGEIIIKNKAAELITYLRYNQNAFSFPDFFRKIASEINEDNPHNKYEVEFEGSTYQITSVLSSNKIHINNYVNDITDLKRYQLELERLSLVAMNYRQGVHFTDADVNITYVNDALLKMTGYSPDELIGKKPMDVFHGPLTQHERYEELHASHSSIAPSEVDLIIYRKDKSWFWANIKKQPLTVKEKGKQEFFSIVEDITEKKMVEESLRNSEARISELIRNLNEGILLEDENRRIMLTNANFCRMFGLSETPDQLSGADCSRSAEERAHLFKNSECFIDRLRIIIDEQKPALAEELEMINGAVLERDYIPILIDGRLKGHLWKYSDISERKNREKALLQQEEKYRNIIANMKMGLLETDTEDNVTYANQEFCEMTGFMMDEILGHKSVDLLVTDEYKDTVKSKYTLRKEGRSDIYQIQVRLRNGETKWWLTSGGPNFNDNGELIGTIGISVDITDQKRLEKELEVSKLKAEESSRAKEAFLASMSHEIRTPLNVIIGMIRELTRESLSDRQNLYIRNAEMASHHLLSIVNDVLDITKIASGQINLDKGAFSLTELINEIVKMLKPESGEKMLGLNATISQMLAPIYIGDANRIKQVLINIVSNSVKFTDAGEITIECTLASKVKNIHQIKIRIADTGIGMEESFLDHIFDKFSQGDYSSARKAGGTGLGMAITYELVRMMNGTISVSSRKGIGTTTEIILGLEVGTIEEIRTSSVSVPFDDLKNKRILLVEDSDLNRLVAINSLNYYGLITTEATNGYEAVEILKGASFDAVLMDLQMPVMGGLEATRIIREEMKLTVPIVALTAHAFKAEIDRCLESGMNDYIIKPFEENALMTILVKCMKDTPGAVPQTAEAVQVSNPNKKLYNLDAIVKMSRGNSDFIKRIIQVFIEQTPVSVEEIRQAWEVGDLDQIRRIAHKIKPNLDNFGISDLTQDIRAIEALAEAGSATAELEEKIKKLETIIRAVVSDLAHEIF